MQGCAPHATSAADCLGAFTNNPQFAQQLFNAGLPVYFIWQLDPFYADDPIIINVVKAFTFTDLVLTQSDPLSSFKVLPWIPGSMPVFTAISRHGWSTVTLLVIRTMLWILMPQASLTGVLPQGRHPCPTYSNHSPLSDHHHLNPSPLCHHALHSQEDCHAQRPSGVLVSLQFFHSSQTLT